MDLKPRRPCPKRLKVRCVARLQTNLARISGCVRLSSSYQCALNLLTEILLLVVYYLIFNAQCNALDDISRIYCRKLSYAYILPKWLNISSNFVHLRVATSHTILVFPQAYQTVWQYSDFERPTPPSRGRRMQQGYEKIAIFDQYLALLQKQYKTDTSRVSGATRIRTRTGSIEWCHFQ